MIKIEEELLALKEEIIQTRRMLHQIPEGGFEEYKTSAFVAGKLREYGIEVYEGIAKTGVIGYFKGTVGDQTIAFRADMDALSVEEKTNLPFQSIHKGMMHACGHDAHMAILLGFAKYLSENREKVKWNVVFLFQPAEEGPGGAAPMIEEGIISKFQIDKVMGLHVFPEVPEGKLACRPGPLMAQTGEFDIKITAQSGHGAIPHKAIDGVVVAANLIMAYQSIISRNIDPVEGAVLTIGKMWGGERRNIIAGEVVLEGTIRAFSEETFRRIQHRMKEIADGMALSYQCRIEIIFRDMYPAVWNHEEMYKQLKAAVGEENMDMIAPQMIAEDFSYFQKKVPGLFFFLGTRNEAAGYVHPLHSCYFSFHEDILLTGIQAYVNYMKLVEAMEA
ncbi:M20 metallopeptidase family protein [Thermotalea metallivorans]|uniref:N-acetyldiaminopimelate deacetylase n=1 Tax=Thermotalea metallivorans TaxID=520762 RepID=A0A140L243_9FIRM|nr:M20 family metallopeptidase [Thermotalea metallivorans]KXG74618.1 N-acetyldiaminopimelate deacetylase [Thermotalea metallivorans]